MKLEDDFEKNNSAAKRLLPFIVLSVIAVMVIVLIVILMNQSHFPSLFSGNAAQVVSPSDNETQTPDKQQSTETPSTNKDSTAEDIQTGHLTSDELDIWDDLDTEEAVEETTTTPTVKEEDNNEEPDPAHDGKHTLIRYANQTEEWVAINTYLPANPYDMTNLVLKDTRMEYYVDQKKSSFLGLMISEYDDYIDFGKVKKSGIDFVIIRLGFRSYGNGELTEDSYFTDNMKRAEDAGLKIGVCFETQAITEEEAAEEAQYLIDKLASYTISYPVVLCLKPILNDTARTDSLSRADRTSFAAKFLSAVKESGYTPVLYANKEWLIKKLNYAALTTYDVWLSNPGDLPDYPYDFDIWEYHSSVKTDGIAANTPISISFIDYSAK